MGLRLTFVSASLVLGLSTSALAAKDRLPLAKPTNGVTTPARQPPSLRPYSGKLHIQRGVPAPRLRMAPSTPMTPMKPVKVNPTKK